MERRKKGRKRQNMEEGKNKREARNEGVRKTHKLKIALIIIVVKQVNWLCLGL